MGCKLAGATPGHQELCSEHHPFLSLFSFDAVGLVNCSPSAVYPRESGFPSL